MLENEKWKQRIEEVLSYKNKIQAQDQSVINEFIKVLCKVKFVYPFVEHGHEAYGKYLECFNDRSMIKEADFQVLRKIITSIVRADRFCEGLIDEALENGTWNDIFKRLEQMYERM